jgi:hypothetical protein
VQPLPRAGGGQRRAARNARRLPGLGTKVTFNSTMMSQLAAALANSPD